MSSLPSFRRPAMRVRQDRSAQTWWVCLAGALLLATSGASLAQQGIPPSERRALIAFFNATHGESWRNASGWRSFAQGRSTAPGAECTWKGVTCDEEGRHVTELLLTDNGLTGILPASIGELSQLEKLDLSFNRLEGEIPPSLFRLRHLKGLYLSDNQLRGNLPLQGTRLANLESLDLSRNYLGGTLGGLGAFPQLVNLDLAGNRFQGRLPESLGALGNLEELNLAGNALTGPLPAAIGRMASLRNLILARNHLTGPLPAELSKLTSLQVLDVSYNGMAGPVPPALARMENLLYLSASHNQFAGTFPVAVCQESLYGVDLSWNRLSRELPADLAKCRGLRRLNLAHNELKGNLPPTLASMDELWELDLSGNHLDGPLPSLKELIRLEMLSLSDNSFEGDLSHAALPELRVLRIDRNRLSGAIPSRLFTDSLRELTLSNNRLTGRVPDALCSASSLGLLDLSHNSLTGPLCQHAGDLEDLRVLNVSYNQLDGPLPPSLFRLHQLTTLFLSNNRFTGSLPDQADSTTLQILDVSHNALTGPLPRWLGQIPLLTRVDFTGNGFTGGLEQLAAAKALRHAGLRENPWTEPLPPRLLALENTSTPRAAVIDPILLTEAAEERPPKPVHPPAPAPPPVPSPPPVPPPPVRILGQTESMVVGTVTDASGAGVRARVAAESASVTKPVDTDDSGRYQIVLPPGKYWLTFSSAGFASQTREVTLRPASSETLDVPMPVRLITKTVVVGASGPQRPGPWWNTWITPQGTPETAREMALEPGEEYSFYLELSGVKRRDLERGEWSRAMNPDLRQRLFDLYENGRPETDLFVRINVIGRAATLTDSVSSVAEWSPKGWAPREGPPTSAVLHLDLSRLLADAQDSSPVDSIDVSARGGAIRFGIKAARSGCAAVAFSIWDSAKTVPLDHLVRMVTVGSQAHCASEVSEKASAMALYSEGSRGVKPDVSLHVFEFVLNSAPHSASFMALANPIEGCESYYWDSDATLSGLVLKSDNFKHVLNQARIDDGHYPVLGERITKAVFPRSRNRANPCGSAAALDALKALAKDREVRLFARISDDSGGLTVVPLGLMASYELAGQRVFANDIRLIEPIALETLEHSDCVSQWTFLLPSELKGFPYPERLKPPPSLLRDPRMVTKRADFECFLNAEEVVAPSGLLLLAHHQNGTLTFSSDKDSLDFDEFDRALGHGSIAVLSACETANLTGDMGLVRRLNENGVDAIVATAFELDERFGATFAFRFAEEVAAIGSQEVTVEDVFYSALAKTVEELSGKDGQPVSHERARGMSRELVLAGNPNLKICRAKTAPSAHECH